MLGWGIFSIVPIIIDRLPTRQLCIYMYLFSLYVVKMILFLFTPHYPQDVIS